MNPYQSPVLIESEYNELQDPIFWVLMVPRLILSLLVAIAVTPIVCVFLLYWFGLEFIHFTFYGNRTDRILSLVIVVISLLFSLWIYDLNTQNRIGRQLVSIIKLVRQHGS